MIAHSYIISKELKLQLDQGLKDLSIEVSNSHSLESFLADCFDGVSRLFILQSGRTVENDFLNTIRDIRTYFGSSSLILVLMETKDSLNKAVYINAGADNILFDPIDKNLLHHFIKTKMNRTKAMAIQHRSVPSGGFNIHVKRKLKLLEMSTEGLKFASEDLYSRGAVISIQVKNLLSLSVSELPCKVITTSFSEEENSYHHIAKYHELSEALLKEIRYCLKHS